MISTSNDPLAWKVTLLATVRVPGELPGAVAPEGMAIGPPIVPVPPSVPPATDTALAAASEPLTSRLPALTVVAPVQVFAPLRVKVPLVDLVSEPLPLMRPANDPDSTMRL